ncbi:hypothetical protein DQ353_11975 [Arthrobacter sp. AQ5-05]|uniref:DUF2975 domain-containing protein n=1 Tax=Arthrobacter sp. AQ5-05 TaxID=2184581 RepID=UPI000DCD97BE|nr:DUF2975 domain-containing protein [Arthrobacter sp. AQ5-05]RAX49040.1 hypothetical protein DQ353_11975 [Arthrobacter sp. AQ5-05]
MDRFSNDLLRFTLVLVGLCLLLGQFLVPVIASETGVEFPVVAHLVLPYSVAGILSLVVLELGLVPVWRLVSLVATGNIFTDGAVGWVNAVIACLATATAIPALVMFHLLFIVGLGGPGVLLALGAVLLGGSALALLLVVMRGLLADAIANRHELDILIDAHGR